MAGLAQALPVALVPEQDRIATVRHDVVHHRRGLQAPCLSARHAQRVAGKVCGPGPAPAGTVASARRARALPVDLRRALRPRLTVHGRFRGQRRLHTTTTTWQARSRPIARARSARRAQPARRSQVRRSMADGSDQCLRSFSRVSVDRRADRQAHGHRPLDPVP
jgi:hypothetical protein